MGSRDRFFVNELHDELSDFHALPLAGHVAYSVNSHIVEVVVVLSHEPSQLAFIAVDVGNPILLRCVT